MVNEKQIQVGKFNIRIHSSGKTGWFEHDDYGEESGGGLWVDEEGNIYDYDGVFELPDEVIEGLEKMGFNTGEVR